MPAEDSEGEKPATTSGTRLVERAVAAPADSQPSQVLMQRVIALSGVVEISDKPARQPVLVGPVEAPKVVHNPPVDLSATSLEWGGRPTAPKARTSEPAQRARPAEAQAAEVQAAEVHAAEVHAATESADYVDAEWATHSSIALQLCEDAPLSHRLLSLNIEDAVTQQYDPSIGPAERELGARFRQPEPSRAPRMLVVPAALAWTVGGAFSVCALALAYLVAAFLLCGHPSLLDPIGLRCVDRADVAKAR